MDALCDRKGCRRMNLRTAVAGAAGIEGRYRAAYEAERALASHTTLPAFRLLDAPAVQRRGAAPVPWFAPGTVGRITGEAME
jgi:hypothetical protein